MKNQKLELYGMIHMYYAGLYLIVCFFLSVIAAHFEIINSELVATKIGEFIIVFVSVVYVVSLPHALIVYYNETKCLAQ
jgi:hypothetical protein